MLWVCEAFLHQSKFYQSQKDVENSFSKWETDNAKIGTIQKETCGLIRSSHDKIAHSDSSVFVYPVNVYECQRQYMCQYVHMELHKLLVQ